MSKIIPKLTIYSIKGDIEYTSFKYSEVLDKLSSLGIIMDNVILNKSPRWVLDNNDVIQTLSNEYNFKHVDIVYKQNKYFAREHFHDDPEMRLICSGSGIFYVNLETHIAKLVCCEGDYLFVPPNTKHWFHSNGFVAVRFFTSHRTWAASYTNSNLPELFE